MKAAPAYFRQKAEQCRQLADVLRDQSDPVVLTLRFMASEFDANADALETRAVREESHLPRGEDAPQLH